MLDRAWDGFHREVIVESFGLFWIAAEIAILFCMGVAARIFAERPVPPRLSLTPRERRLLGFWCAAFGLLALGVYGRHVFLAPLPFAVESIAAAGDEVYQRARAAYLQRADIHILIWCSFIVVWMALEIAIVAQGIRAYARLRRLIAETRHAA